MPRQGERARPPAARRGGRPRRGGNARAPAAPVLGAWTRTEIARVEAHVVLDDGAQVGHELDRAGQRVPDPEPGPLGDRDALGPERQGVPGAARRPVRNLECEASVGLEPARCRQPTGKKFVRPTKPATKRVRRRVDRARAGVADLLDHAARRGGAPGGRPRRSSKASSWSWVTRRVVRPSRAQLELAELDARVRARSVGSRFESGSSRRSRRRLGDASARASATRCCWAARRARAGGGPRAPRGGPAGAPR